MIIIDKILRFLRGLFVDKTIVRFIDDIPEHLDEKFIYVIGSNNNYWLIVFKCPCNCNNSIYLNLLKEELPSWRYRIVRNKITVNPSIRRTKGCRSHFWIRNNKVIWCRESLDNRY